MKRASSSMLMTELSEERRESRVEGRGDEDMYAETELDREVVWFSILSASREGDGGRGMDRAKDRVVRGVRVARGRGSESDLRSGQFESRNAVA